MESFPFTILDGRTSPPTDDVRECLRRDAVSVVRLYDENDPILDEYENGIDECASMLRADNGTPNGARGMGGITKGYGGACHPGVARIRLDPKARGVHAGIYGAQAHEVCTGWDAVGILGTDAVRKRPARAPPEDPSKAFFDLTGGSLQPHVDVGKGSYGSNMEQRMREVHPVFHSCVQSFLVCRSVPQGGATLVVSPGPWYDNTADTAHFHFENGRDFCTATEEGYAHFHGTWRAIDNVPRGCLVLWLSRAPHGNKLADVGVDPQRRVVYISWQMRTLIPTQEERDALTEKKMSAILSGGTTDHWATHVPKVHRGSHMSNGKKTTSVIFSRDAPPEYDEELIERIREAL